jgi:transferase CAF17, mitochondrial
VLFDSFIYATTPEVAGIESTDPGQVYVIDVHKSQLGDLKTHLARFKLRSKFTAQELSLQVYSIWPHVRDHIPGSYCLRDPRSAHLGDRLLTLSPPSLPVLSEDTYHIRRTLLGVPEGPEEIIPGVALPAESDLDVLGGVDYSKGCYVGQELTSRTYHTGVIRKRLLPMSLFTGEEPSELEYNPMSQVPLPEPGSAFETVGKRSPGRWLRGWGNVGWGIVRLEVVGKVLSCDVAGKTVLAKVFLPEWGK